MEKASKKIKLCFETNSEINRVIKSYSKKNPYLNNKDGSINKSKVIRALIIRGAQQEEVWKK